MAGSGGDGDRFIQATYRNGEQRRHGLWETALSESRKIYWRGHRVTWQGSVERSGFAILPQVLSREEVASLLDDVNKSTLHRSRAGIRHALKHPAVAELANDERLLNLAKGILGEEAIPFHATLFDKSPAANWLVMWHQDTALPIRERREAPGWGPWSVKEGVTYAHAPASALSKVLALRVHLDDSTESNGPLRVLPGTHNLGVIEDQVIHKLAEDIVPVECLIEQGGVLAMRPLILHASSKSTGTAPRRVIHIEYASSMRVGDGFELAR
jgi:ectoine hydroxylase-related dioxygenase (phytanoyl-CoA dioxygenase family)